MKNKLNELVEKYRLIEYSWEFFWESYDNYIIIEPEESAENAIYNRNSIEPMLYSISYRIKAEYEDFDSEVIIVRIDMRLKSNDNLIGHYACIFDLNGECIDDYFVID